MSLFGGGRREPRQRTEAERRQAMIERERRRLGDPAWIPPAGHPLAAPLSSGGRGSEDRSQSGGDRKTSRQPHGSAQRQTTSGRRAAADQRGAWPPPLEDLGAELERPRRRAPAARGRDRTPGADAGDEPQWFDETEPPAAPVRGEDPLDGPLQIEPDPPAQELAPAFELPDDRRVAVHRRRALTGRPGARTVVSPPGDADMGGTLVRGSSPRRRITLAIIGLLLAAFVVFQWQLWQPLKGGGTEAVSVKIPEGAGAQEVGQVLADAGVIDSPRMFSLRTLLAGMRHDLPAGNVKLKQDMSYGAALAALSGATPAVPDLQSVTIQEGLSIGENARRLKRAGIVDDYGQTAKAVFKERRSELRKTYKLPAKADSLEGFLFPATYELPRGAEARLLIERQLDAFEQNFDTVSMTRARRANLTPYDVITIASMVEREARLTRERPLIAAVIYNRLNAGMPLGIDATFRYASGDWTNPIRQSQLEKDGPYNSRTRTGLPPTPIGNPGLASIEAAAAPAKVDYLYFVVKPNRCGEHAFSSTEEKFLADQAKYNAAREKAGGSPVTC